MSQRANPITAFAARLARAAGPALIAIGRGISGLAAVAWPILRTLLRRTFEIIFAIILIFEEWGWRPLAAALARLARFPSIARLEAVIAGLPPYGALVAFALPSLLIFPLKLLALYLITTGHAISAALLFIGAKIAGTAVLARLFMLTQPQLMQIAWFARLYNWLMPWKDRAFTTIRQSWAWRYGRTVKHQIGNIARARWRVWRPYLVGARDKLVAQFRAWRGQ